MPKTTKPKSPPVAPAKTSHAGTTDSPPIPTESASTPPPPDTPPPPSEIPSSFVIRNSSFPPPSAPLRNPQHETFAHYLAEGDSPTDAYRRAYPCARRRRQNGYAYNLRRRPEIAARIIWLQEQAATNTIMNLREILQFLTAVKRTPVGQVTVDSELAERFEETASGAKKISMPDKRACIELFAKLQGMLVDRNKTEHSGQIEHTLALSESTRAQLLERHRQALLQEPTPEPEA